MNPKSSSQLPQMLTWSYSKGGPKLYFSFVNMFAIKMDLCIANLRWWSSSLSWYKEYCQDFFAKCQVSLYMGTWANNAVFGSSSEHCCNQIDSINIGCSVPETRWFCENLEKQGWEMLRAQPPSNSSARKNASWLWSLCFSVSHWS